MNILIVLTSHDRLGDSGHPTGFWLEELAAPYYVFKDAGAHITLASPKGGQPPLDPRSNEEASQSDVTRRFAQDPQAQAALANTVLLSSVSHEEFDAVFYPGGHGPLWDLVEDPDSIVMIESMYAAGKPVAAICHGPAALLHAKLHDGRPLLSGKRVTGFANSEEQAVGLQDVVPFLLEDVIGQCGGKYEKGADFTSHVVVDGHLITGQNPAASAEAARATLKMLQER